MKQFLKELKLRCGNLHLEKDDVHKTYYQNLETKKNPQSVKRFNSRPFMYKDFAEK